MTIQLPRRTHLGSRETAASYVSRLAAINLCAPRQICVDMGTSLSDVAKGREQAFERIAAMTGADEKALKRHSLVRDGDIFYLNGQKLNRPALRRARTFVCPLCVKDDIGAASRMAEVRTFCRDQWMLASIDSCHRHNVYLEEIFPEAGGAMVYDFASAMAMSFPAPWEIKPSELPTNVSEFEKYLLGRLDGLTGATPWLDALPWYAAARACKMLGAVSTQGSHARTSQFSRDDWYKSGIEGFYIATSGPDAIKDLLTQLQADFMKTRAYWGLRATFGRLYEWLAHEDQDPSFDPLRSLIRDHAIATMPIGAGELIFGKPVERRIVHSVHSAHQEMGVHPKRLRKLLLEAKLIMSDDLKLSNDRILFDVAKAQESIANIAGSMKLNEVGRYLNIPRAQLRVLLASGHLKPFVPAGSGDIGSHAFSKAEIDSLLEGLLSEAVDISTPAPHQHNILGAAKRANCSAAEIVELILSKRVTWKGIDPNQTGYLSVLVDVNEIKHLVRRADNAGIKLREIETRLHVSTRVLNALIEHGHLQAMTVINPVNRCPQRVVMENDLVEFQTRYISLMDLAAERNVYGATLKKELTAAGVIPAFDPEKVPATFYRRDQLPTG